MPYQPKYDTTIQTRERAPERITTRHTEYIDWEYPFEEVMVMAGCYPRPQERAARQVELLKKCEGENVYATDYGGWPRCGWGRVLAVGMVSQWPYWEPRPCVLVNRTLGAVWIDWASLTDVETRNPDPHP